MDAFNKGDIYLSVEKLLPDSARNDANMMFFFIFLFYFLSMLGFMMWWDAMIDVCQGYRIFDAMLILDAC